MKKLILNEKVLTIQEWLTEQQVETNQQQGVTKQSEINSDIDTILSKLKELEDNMDEMVSSYEELSTSLNEEELNEDEAGKLKDFVFVAPKVRKMQQKANKIRLNKVDLEFAIANAPADKKKRLEGKAKDLGKDITELEDSIDDYQKDSGSSYSLKVKSMERIKGKLAAIKRKTGLNDDPKKKADLKRQMQTLADNFKEEAAAAKELQKNGPSAEEIKTEIEKNKKTPKKDPATTTEPEKANPPKTTEPEKTNPPKTAEPKTKEPEKTTPPEGEKVKGQTEQTPEQKAKNSKEGKLKRLKDLLPKVKGEDQKAKIQAMIDKLQKESWELFLDDKYVAIVEAEIVEFEKSILS